MFSYKKFKGFATITSYNGNEKIVHIPTSIDGYKVSKIAAMCFFGNEEVEEIHFPDNVSIENNAIVDCPNLKTIYVSKVVRLGNFIEDCEKVEIITNDKASSKKMKNQKLENVYDISIFEICKTSETTAKIMNIKNIKKANGPKVIHIPNVVNGLKITELNEFLFCDTKLEEVTLNDYIKELPAKCFNYANLKRLKNTSHITKVGDNCFNQTYIDEEVHFPNLEEVSYAGFYNSSFDIVPGRKIKNIEAYGFAYSFIKEIHLPKHVNMIKRSAFEGCCYLVKVTLPKTIEVLHRNCFEACSELREVKNLNNVKVFNEEVFSDCDKFVVRISFDNGKLFKENSFSSTNLPQKIEIKDCTFEKGALSSAHKVKTIIFTNEYKHDNIPNNLMYWNKSINEVVLNDTITTVNDNAFRYSSLKKINLDNVKFIGKSAFAETNLKRISARNLEKADVGAFERCAYLKEASFLFNKMLREFPTYLFYGCSLESINFPENLKVIGSSAFFNCCFKEMRLPNTIEELKESFIGNNYKLEYLEIPTSVKIFGEGCFANIGSTTRKGTYIRILGTPELKERKLFNCSNLKNTTLDLSNCKIEEFSTCMFDHLIVKELILPKNVKKVGEFAFKGAKIQNLVIDYDSIEEIGKYGFAFASIQNLQVPKNVKIIGDNSFYDSHLNLEKVELVVNEIGESAFWSSGTIKEIVFKTEPSILKRDNFERCGITKISAISSKTLTKLKSRTYFKTFACEFQKIK